MELEQEVLHLREKCRNFGLLARDMKKQLLAMYEPKPRPRPEILVGLSLLATLEGLPARCPDHACRRDGRCHAKDIGEHPCADLWTAELFDRFDLMAIGIELSAICDERDRAMIHERITQSFETPKPARRRKRGG